MGQIAEKEGFERSYVLGEDISTAYVGVIYGDSAGEVKLPTADGQEIVGIIQNSGLEGEAVKVVSSGVSKVLASGTWSAHADLMVENATGKFKAWTTGIRSGIAEDAVGSGETYGVVNLKLGNVASAKDLTLTELEVNGDITLENDEVISNSVDGQISFGAANLATTGTLGVGGDVTFENDEKISNSTDGQLDIIGNQGFIPGTSGGWVMKVSEATADITAAASINVPVNVPNGSKLIGTQMRVDAALAAGELWDAEWNDGGSMQAIASGAAVAQNTKVNKWHDDNANTPICDAETDIVVTKNGGGSFTAQGTIRALAYYLEWIALADAS